MKNKGYRLNVRRNNSSNGYTLIEVLIASALGVFIMAGTVALYAANKSTMQVQNNLSEIQKNGRFLIDRLSTRIQNAAYSGFYQQLSTGLENILLSPTDSRWNLGFPVYGFDNVTTAQVGIANIVAGTDVLLLKTMTNMIGLVSTSSASTMSVNVNNGFAVGDMVIATNQDLASIFQVMAVDTSTAGQTDLTIAVGSAPVPGNSTTLGNVFGTDAQVGQLESLIYFLSTGSNGRTALFEGRLLRSGSPSSVAFDSKELIDNVENMQIVYGLDTDDDENIDIYSTASTITANSQWSMVRNVGLTLLLASTDDRIASAANSYTYSSVRNTFIKDDTAAVGADRRLRRVFTMHVATPNM